MRTIILIIVFLLRLTDGFGICGYDDRTLTQMLFENKAGTIFTCRILTMAVPKQEGDMIVVNACGGGIDGTAMAQIIRVYFGKVDTNVVTLRTESSLEVGKSYLIYTIGEGRLFGCGGHCDQWTHQITDSPEDRSELKILEQFADVYKNKKSGKYTFLSAKKIVLASGEFKKGIPVKTWKHYFADGSLKTEEDLEAKSKKVYSANGLMLVHNVEYKDSSVSLAYSNVVSGRLDYRWVTFPNSKGFVMTMYEYYPNGNLKLCESTVYVGEKGGGISSNGKTGRYIEGYENGKIKVLGAMNHLKRIGRWKWYNDDGSLNAEFDYRDGTGNQ